MDRLTSFPNPELTGLGFPQGVSRGTPWYRWCRCFLQVTFCAYGKVRVFNRCYEPTSGGAVYICNHQSFMDPILMSFALRRPMSYMARDTLFQIPLFGRIISSVYAFPVRRGSADTGALKEAMRRLKAGGQVVVFPEGTRTTDGRIGSFLAGVALLAQRANAVTVPVVIDGAYECWPRTQMLPSPGNIVVQYGKPISVADARKMAPQAFVHRVRAELIDIQTGLRHRVGRPALKYE